MSGARERRRADTRAALRRHALRLFAEQGYDATTVEQIAGAAGVSHMTFFRHFAGKAAVFDLSGYDDVLRRSVEERPATEDPLTAMHRGTVQALAAIDPADRSALLAVSRLIVDTPSLNAHLWRRRLDSEQVLAAAVAGRGAEPHLRHLAAAYLALTGSALRAWVDSDGRADLAGLVEEAFAALCGAAATAGRTCR